MNELSESVASVSSGVIADDGRGVECAVLFSGGRDSTLAALQAHESGAFLQLLSFDTGLGYGGARMREIRLSEMRACWGRRAFKARTIPVYGLVRRLCFSDLVDDVLTDRRQLILLGEFLAMLTASIILCRRSRLNSLIYGAASYQSYFPEQQPAAVELFRTICATYDVELLTPVYGYSSDLEVKLRLVEAGLTSKSLEGSSLLADIDDSPPVDVVTAYIERKIPQINAIISRASSV